MQNSRHSGVKSMDGDYILIKSARLADTGEYVAPEGWADGFD